MKRALVAALLLCAACRSAPTPRRPNDVTVGPTRGPGIAGTPCSDEGAEPATEDEAYGRKIAVICIDGVRADARKTVEKALGFEAGAVLTEKGLRDGLEAIHKTNVADDVTAYAWKLGPGIVLGLRLRERPRVGKVTLEGAAAVNIEVQKAAEPTPLQTGQHYDPRYALARANALRDAYASAGWEDATVTPETKPAGEGVVDVRMVIHEGVRSSIGAITTKGVSPALEAGLLKESKLVRGEPITPDTTNDAGLRITSFYYDHGHVSVNVKVDRGARATDGSVPLTINVTEGPMFTIGKLELKKSGLDAATTQKLIASLRSKSGAVFRRSVLVDDIATVKHAYSDRGRIVEVLPQTEINQEKQTMDVALEITNP